MADHFRAVGCDIGSLQEFGQFAAFVGAVLASIGQKAIVGEHGKLGIWGPDQGVELYLHSFRKVSLGICARVLAEPPQFAERWATAVFA